MMLLACIGSAITGCVGTLVVIALLNRDEVTRLAAQNASLARHWRQIDEIYRALDPDSQERLNLWQRMVCRAALTIALRFAREGNAHVR